MHKIIQCTETGEWLKERSKGIGGSDAACILGLNPYKTNVELWKEKTGRAKAQDISQKSCVIYGKKAEEYLRELFILDYPEYLLTYREFDILTNIEHPFIRCTLDGELKEKNSEQAGFLEIKTTEIKRKSDWQKWDNQIPMNYFCQILHCFAVDVDFKFAKVKSQIKYRNADNKEIKLETRHYHILRENHKADIETVIEKELEFYWYIEHDKEPPLILPEI